MNWKKVVSVLLVSAMTLSMAACGDTASTSDNAAAGTETKGSTANASSDEKLVVWTLSNDLIDFGKRFQEQTGVEVDTVVIEPADYPTKVQTALLAGEKEPDIIVGEPKMLEDFFDAGFFEDLNQAPYNAQDYADQIVDYVWQVGQDDDGIQRAISYQITPAGIYYRRDIAKEVFGTDDPDEVGKLFKDYPTILETAQTLKDAGYRIFSSDAEMNVFSGDSAWVVDGTLNVDQSRIDYMDLCVDLYQNDLTAYASQWSTPWYQAMAGEVPILTADIQSNADDSVNVWDADQFAEATKGLDTTTVFAFGLPSWGVLTMRDNVGETSGLWGVCSGPAAGFDGGTYIGISSQSERKDTAWEFVKFCTLNEDTANWWIEYSQIDGIRQDTHPYADYDFMATWCKEVENEYPDFNIVGEAWYPRGTASAWWQRDSKMNESNSNLKTVMDFDLTFTCQKAFGDACSSREGFEAGLFKIYEVIAQDFLFPDPNNVLVFLDNHDLGRFMQKGESDLRRYKQAIAFLLTTRGIPQIYYGTEILMSGTKAEGDGIIRTDFPGGWAGDPKDAFTPEGRTDLQNQAWDYMRKLLNWRQRCDAVKEGKLIHYTPDKSGCYVYARVKDNKTVLVLMNGTDQNQTLDMNRFHEVVKDYRSGKDIITDTIVAIDTAVHIPARGVYILELV